MWRDAIQKQLNFEELLVDFLTITILLEGSKPIQRQVYNYKHTEAIFSWSETVKIISADKDTKIMLIYTLRVVEKKEFEYKHDGPPLAILNNIEQTNDNNAAMQSPPPPAPAVASNTVI